MIRIIVPECLLAVKLMKIGGAFAVSVVVFNRKLNFSPIGVAIGLLNGCIRLNFFEWT